MIFDEQSIHTRRQFLQITVRGSLDSSWSAWFGGLAIEHCPGADTELSGTVVDAAALYGVISRLKDLGIVLLSIASRPVQGTEQRQDGDSQHSS